jgi:hypothetical protein
MLAVHNSDRNFYVNILAIRQMQSLGSSISRIEQRHRHFGVNVGADAKIFRLKVRTRARPCSRAAAERFPQDILKAAEAATGCATR